MTSATREYHPEPRSVRIKRRLVTVPRTFGLLLAFTLLFPLLATVAIVVDATRWVLSRRPWVTTRLLAFGWMFLAAETWGIVRFAWTWVLSGFGRNRERLVASTWPIQTWWSRTLLGSIQRLFSIELHIENEEAITPGPILAMFRHASIVDNLLPAVLVTDRHGIRMRWVIKKELLSHPALDIGGNRLPNYFVDREAKDSRAEIERIRALATDLAPDEGVLIYPEGTRFTEEKRERALERLRQGSPRLYERARRLRHVLPPRIGGPLILLDAGIDVLLCGHEGLGGFAHLSDIWSGDIVGRSVYVRFWRVPASAIPEGRSERIDWLFAQWQAIDDWIDELEQRRP